MCFKDNSGGDPGPAPRPVVTRGPAQGGSQPYAPPHQSQGPGRTGRSPPSRGSRPATAGHGGPSYSAPSASSRPQRPQRTEKLMTAETLDEYLQALHRGFGDLEYGIIGGAALLKYGSRRKTSDVDVIIPESISEVAESRLLDTKVGIVRTDRGHLGYMASDGLCYGLDITTDRALSQSFRSGTDTTRLPGSEALFVNIVFLLNSKAYSYLSRSGPDAMQKKDSDARDIIFILGYMESASVRASKEQCRWVIDYNFWMGFTRAYDGQEARLMAIGLQRERTPSHSNRSSLRASSERRRSDESRRSSGSGRNNARGT
ncbi:hypothetical protein EPUS_05250 [Endocarpon pusillum Z07020]|uniref:Uncharacterized protein n=1 Tax=Endocarpon pusillum (strain Z07020 / HMAS-L-300199) TaxID=1263415 RepID=U1HH61_ENDPU|nr:uncharacterized protein EPUS_05250 [Endocarpon pusillum Z07020]ERF68169.1 hypothetical protein EPUS_05250 [Endocarpon pusillum Z07020]